LLPPVVACGAVCLLKCDGLRTVYVAQASSELTKPNGGYSYPFRHASTEV